MNWRGSSGAVENRLPAEFGTKPDPDMVTITSLPDSGYARGRRTMEFTNVNIATLPPIPMLRERIAVRAKPGAERRLLYAPRTSSIHITSLQI
jgi:hypothetical protein